jgi:hydroxyethylthiazole kinase-like uncharacterized protein yjeF
VGSVLKDYLRIHQVIMSKPYYVEIYRMEMDPQSCAPTIYNEIPMASVLSSSIIRRLLPRRAADTHKGDFGHVLVVAGSRLMPGAAVLASLGALRAGAGLVTVACDRAVQMVVHHFIPEAMAMGRDGLEAFCRKRRITALAIGPGLGVGAAQKALVLRLLKLKLPTVLDADGLNNLSLDALPRPAGFLVITPHEGELAHLQGVARESIHARRAVAARETAQFFGGVCVLKGHRTLIADSRRLFENHTGNAAMAAGGMGDVLTGVIAGLLAQKLNPFDAACAGVYLHGLAGDLSAVADRGLLAHEVANAIPKALAQIHGRS